MSKTVLITGASRGIGAAIAEAFAREGYQLSLCCKESKDQLMELANRLYADYQAQVLTHVGDVGDVDFVKQMIRDTKDQYGSIDVVINNAGIAHIGLLSDMTDEEWNRMLATDLSSVFYICRAVIPSMVKVQSGRIINISSVWGNVGASCEVAYSACKGAINAMTKALGKELAPSHIQVNAIACGAIDTDMNACFSREDLDALCEEIPAGRMGRPEEVAALALQIASGSEYLNGQVITLDGGWQ